MKNLFFKSAFILTGGLTACLSGFSPSSAQQKAVDLILHNGVIWTVDDARPQARAVAIGGNKIVEVGDDAAVLQLKGARTRVIDLQGAFVTPGFNDNHVHFAGAARFFWHIQLMDVHGDAAFIERVKAYVKERPDEPIRGGGWGAYEQWEAGASKSKGQQAFWTPDRKLIDAMTGDTPMFLNKFDGSMFFANTKALRNAGIPEEATDSDEIEHLRDKNGRLTGAMRIKNRRGGMNEFAEKFLGGRQAPDLEKRIKMSQNALDVVRAAGVTSFQDMSDHEQLQIYNILLDRGELSARVNFRYGLEFWKEMEALGVKRGSGNAMIRLGAVKGHIDGIMGTSSARFYQPYDSDPEGKNRGKWRRLTWVSPEQPARLNRGPFTQMMIDADAADIQVTVHAIGDEANGIMLDMIEAMTRANGRKDRRMRLVHAQVFAPRDFKRLNGLGIVAEVQPFHLSDDMRWMEERIGHERCKGAYAFKTLRDNGAILSFGSDWPGTTAAYYPINPVYGIYAAVTRQTVRQKPENGWFPEERISVEEAIKAYTRGSAYASFEEELKGVITKGKLADLTVLDTNLLKTNPHDWLDGKGGLKVKVLYTIVDGRIVYQRNPLTRN